MRERERRIREMLNEGEGRGPRMGYRSRVVLPEEMSPERFEKIRGYRADGIATPAASRTSRRSTTRSASCAPILRTGS